MKDFFMSSTLVQTSGIFEAKESHIFVVRVFVADFLVLTVSVKF